MTADSAECLARVLGQCPALGHLDLTCTAVGALVPRDVAIQEVFVPYGETLYSHGGAGVVAILAQGLMQRPCLSEINLSGNEIGPVGAECLADALRQCPELVKLELQNNNIRSRGAQSLLGVLEQCTALAHLNLRNNMIGPTVDGLAGILGQCSALVHLDLGENCIGLSYKTILRASWCGEVSGLLLGIG